MKRVLIVYLMLCIISPIQIEAKKKSFGNGLYWELSSDGTLTISGNGDMPNFRKKRPWESSSGKVYKVVIENGVTSIGDRAFSCFELEDVIIPNSIIRIGADAFFACVYITSIKLNEGLKQIGASAFWGCRFKNLIIPNTVNKIGNECFAFCSNLESVIMSDNITDIPDDAFEDCVSLKYVKFPSRLRTIGNRAFSIVGEGEHGILEHIDLPIGVESIGEKAFCGNVAKYLVIPKTVHSIGKNAFSSSPFLSKYVDNYKGEIRSLPAFVNENNATIFGLDGDAVWRCLNSIYNMDGKIVVPAKRGRVVEKRRFGSTNTEYYEVDEGGVKGIVNNNGMWIVSVADGYSEVTLINGNYFRIRKGNYYGIIASNGETIIPTSRGYTSISYDGENKTFVFSKKGFTGICNKQGKEISFTKLAPTIEEIKANGNYASVISVNNVNKKYYIVRSKEWRYGLIDVEGNVIVPTEMNSLEEAGAGFLKFKVGSYWGIMNYDAKVIIPTERGYTWIGNYVSTTKRFPYEMDGYKGECNQFGQQVSKIKVAKPKLSTTSSPANSSSSSSVYNDCMTFDLKGNVKKVTCGSDIREFDRSGKLIPGRNENIVYDGRGRVSEIKLGVDGLGGGYKFEYGSNGKVVVEKKSASILGVSAEVRQQYFYNSKGHMVKCIISSQDSYNESVVSYSNYTYDSRGNWTSRKKDGKLETRTIEYY